MSKWIAAVVVLVCGLALGVFMPWRKDGQESGRPGAQARDTRRTTSAATEVPYGLYSSDENGNLVKQRKQGPIPKFENPVACNSKAPFGGNINVDISSPDYDPAKYATDFGKLFDQEPRKPQWAPFLESTFSKLLKEDLSALLPGMGDVSLECKSVICRLQWTGAVQNRNKMSAILVTLYNVDSFQYDGKSAFLSFGGKQHQRFRESGQALIDNTSAERAKRLATLRAGKLPAGAYRHIAANEWPER